MLVASLFIFKDNLQMNLKPILQGFHFYLNKIQIIKRFQMRQMLYKGVGFVSRIGIQRYYPNIYNL